MITRIDTLFQKFIDGNCTRQEYDELMDLLQQNKHEEKFHAMLHQVYQHTTRSLPSGIYVDNNGELQTTGNARLDEQIHTPKKRNRAGFAVVVLLVVVSGVWLWYHSGDAEAKKPSVVESTVKKFTERAEQKTILLPDSTHVWLNVASTLEFPESFASTEREVYLTGEAFFEVKHAEQIPFVIHAGAVSTRVTGTAVNVKAYPDQQEVEISVKRGKVHVSKHDKLVAIVNYLQKVKLGNGLEEFPVVPAHGIAEWRTGSLVFDSTPVADVLKDFEKVYNVTIEATTGTDFITASFRRDIGVEQALDILCASAGLAWHKENGIYIVLKS